MRLGLCLLTWNEVEGCRIDVPLLPLDEFDEVFAVDGGSTDGTVEFLESVGIQVFEQPIPSLNAACNHAYEVSTCDALVFFHPKGTVPPGDVSEFRPLFEQGYDLVVASRSAIEGRNEEDDRLLRPRKWFVAAVSMMVSILWNRHGYRVRDVLHGFRGMTRSGYMQVAPAPSGVTIDIEMVVGSYQNGLSCTEFPTTETRRPAGDTHFAAVPTGWRILQFVGRSLVDTSTRSPRVGKEPND